MSKNRLWPRAILIAGLASLGTINCAWAIDFPQFNQTTTNTTTTTTTTTTDDTPPGGTPTTTDDTPTTGNPDFPTDTDTPTTTAQTPEPGTLLLGTLAMGIVGIGTRRRK